MRAVVQRVANASVSVDGQVLGQIGQGLLVFVGVQKGDSTTDVKFLADKVQGLRIFDDDNGFMNRSVVDVGASLLVVSQFTLLGDVRRGKRPSFSDAAPPADAQPLYADFCRQLAKSGLAVAEGRFQADMQVALLNDGPVTIMLDSRKLF